MRQFSASTATYGQATKLLVVYDGKSDEIGKSFNVMWYTEYAQDNVTKKRN